MLRDTGGIKPHERKRAVAHLTLSEREEIRAGLSAKMSIRAIATALNRSPSTISREVQRNRGRRYYKAGDDSNLLIVFYVQIMPDDFVMQLHRF